MAFLEENGQAQVIQALNEPAFTNLHVNSVKELGKGGQGEVHRIKIEELPGLIFVDKLKKVVNANADLANKLMLDLLTEFWIAKDLQHERIIKYKYFIKRFCEKE